MSTTFQKHLIGVEDLSLDTAGTDAVDIKEYDGSEFKITALNASHIPIRQTLRDTFKNASSELADSSNIGEVESALTNLIIRLKKAEQDIQSGGGGGGGGGGSSACAADADMMKSDTVVSFSASETASEINTDIEACKKNLGGRKLTLNFYSTSTYANLGNSIIISGFYNGTLIIEGGAAGSSSGSTVFSDDSSTFATYGAIFRLARCYCDVQFRNIQFIHSGNPYSVSLSNCPGVLFESCTFTGSSGKYAVYYDKSYAKRENCTLTGDSWGKVQDTDSSGNITNYTDPLTGFVADEIGKHNTAASVHSNKANLASPAFTGTPTVPTIESTETATQQIANAAWVHSVIGSIAVPAGAVTAYAGGGSIPSGWLLCDGSTYSASTYPDLYNAIGNTYGTASQTGYFKVPDFRGAFLRGYLSKAKTEVVQEDSTSVTKEVIGATGTIGTRQEEGLPGITGSLMPGTSEGNNYGFATPTVTGAFSTGKLAVATFRFSGSHDDCHELLFDARRCSTIYGSSTHVTPVNYAIQWIIKT